MKTFQEMALAKELHQALNQLKFREPTEIQSAVIPVAMEGKDLMACAQTGSGKTAAYGIPLISKLLEDPKANALVLAPTRELAHQISDFLRELASFCERIQVTAIVGGADMRRQLQILKKKPRIIVATPGRLTDHLHRKSCRLQTTKFLVLDEGDRMLDMGFAPQLDEILKFLPNERQTSLFTATLPKKIQKLAGTYLVHPQRIDVGYSELPVASVKQSVLQLSTADKKDRIVEELNQRQGSIIIFSRTKSRTDTLGRHLSKSGFSVDVLHGGKTQGQRNKAIQGFRRGKSRILCATDIAARGIDIPEVAHVINFDLPVMEEDYIHRIGRTARNGASGEALSFVTPEDHRTWIFLARKFKIEGVELKAVAGERRPSKGKRSYKVRIGGETSFKDHSRGPSSRKKKRSFKNSEDSAERTFSRGPKRKPKDQKEDKPFYEFGKRKRFSKAAGFKKKKKTNRLAS